MSISFRALLGFLAAFCGSLLLLCLLKDKLPQDHGRAFAVNGEKSKGKARGSGIVFIPVFAVVSLLLTPFSTELILYLGLILLAMLTGYLDDRSSLPWGELKKGLLDLAICIAAVVVFMSKTDETVLRLFGLVIPLPKWLFFLFALFVLWAFINCCNCTDGVDGHLGTLTLISVGSVICLLSRMPETETAVLPGLFLIGAVAAYLLLNASPSLIMMGDAGSRAIGLFLGLLILKTGNMLNCIPFAAVILLDGGLGLLKLSVMRLFHSKTFMVNLRTPLHDEARKNRGWSDTQTVFRFALIQLVLCVCGLIADCL